MMTALLAASLMACGERREASRKTDTGPQAKVVATVNGVPLTEHDLKLVIKRTSGGHGGESQNPAAADNVLQTLVRNELIYQKSLELGLDKDAAYRGKLAEAEAQLRVVQRQEMSALYQRHLKSKAEVTDGEAKDYFEKNAKKLQTKFHVWQLFYRGNDPRISKDLQDLKSGMPFEKVAARQYPPNLPREMKAPWDLGELRWSQIPEPWQGVLDRLAPGQVSEVIKGPRDRFWVIKLVKKTVNPQIAFATEKEKITEILRQQKAEALYNSMLAEMKEKAKIVYPK